MHSAFGHASQLRFSQSRQALRLGGGGGDREPQRADGLPASDCTDWALTQQPLARGSMHVVTGKPVAGSPDDHPNAFGLAAMAIHNRMVQQRAARLCERGNSTDRVRKAASATAKYILRQGSVAHAFGFGSDSLACKLMPFWQSDWPEEMERTYASLLRLEYEQMRRLKSEASSVWSRIFADRVAAGVPDGSLGIGCVALFPNRRPSYLLVTCRLPALTPPLDACGTSSQVP